jgi:hypothetical protein
MNIEDEVRDLRKSIADINLRLNSIRLAAIGAHDVLSVEHPDAAPGAVVEGAMIRGNATPEWEAFGPGDEDDVLTIVGGIPDWAPGGGGTVDEKGICFLDTFGDASIYWTWRTITGAGRTIAEAGGLMTLIVTNGTNAAWHGGSNNAVRAWLNHVSNPPFEVIAKIDHVHMLADMHCGIFISKDATAAGGNVAVMVGRHGIGGVAAEEIGVGTSALIADTTDPHWLKIRVIGGEYRNQISYWFSTDGTTWQQFLTGGGAGFYTNDFWSSYGFNCGLVIRNWGGYLACEMNADDFKMVRCLGPR